MGASTARGSGTVLALVRPGSRADLERSLEHFRRITLALVLSPPNGEEEEWANRLAQARSAPHSRSVELAAKDGEESDETVAARAWQALERVLGGGHVRVLAVLPHDVLGLSLASGLGFPLARARDVRVDPGRVVLLRDDPIGIVLRRCNVLSLEEQAGTPLPGGAGAGREGAR